MHAGKCLVRPCWCCGLWYQCRVVLGFRRSCRTGLSSTGQAWTIHEHLACVQNRRSYIGRRYPSRPQSVCLRTIHITLASLILIQFCQPKSQRQSGIPWVFRFTYLHGCLTKFYPETYLVFIALQCLAAPIGLLLSPPEKVNSTMICS